VAARALLHPEAKPKGLPDFGAIPNDRPFMHTGSDNATALRVSFTANATLTFRLSPSSKVLKAVSKKALGRKGVAVGKYTKLA
jgi:hypothetical protein